MKTLKIALLQIAPCGDLEQNRIKGLEACKKAKAQGADIALFPEMWSNGYDIYEPSAEEWTAQAIDAESEFIGSFGSLAKELELAIGITFLEKTAGKPRNSMVLFDRFGQRLFTYAKVHTCDFSAEQHLQGGDDFYVADLDTAQGKIRVGAMICYDREFPESARLLMLKGAELILVPNACPMEINRLSQLRGRAYENMVAIATCNYPDSVPDCNGGSSVFDGVAYLPELEGSRDTCILQAGGEEGIYLASLDVAQLRRYRAEEVQGDAYRHPEKYGALAPFFKSVLDVDPAPVVLCDLEHTVVYMNASSVARYGRNLCGESLFRCHPPAAIQKIEQVVEWFKESKEHNCVYTYRNEQENKDVYMVALRDEQGALIGYYEKHLYRTVETEPLYYMGE